MEQAEALFEGRVTVVSEKSFRAVWGKALGGGSRCVGRFLLALGVGGGKWDAQGCLGKCSGLFMKTFRAVPSEFGGRLN